MAIGNSTPTKMKIYKAMVKVTAMEAALVGAYLIPVYSTI